MHKAEKWATGSAWAFPKQNVSIFEAGLMREVHLFPPKGRKEAGWVERSKSHTLIRTPTGDGAAGARGKAQLHWKFREQSNFSCTPAPSLCARRATETSVPTANRAASGFEPMAPKFPLSVCAADLQSTRVLLPPFGEPSLLCLQISFVFISRAGIKTNSFCSLKTRHSLYLDMSVILNSRPKALFFLFLSTASKPKYLLFVPVYTYCCLGRPG